MSTGKPKIGDLIDVNLFKHRGEYDEVVIPLPEVYDLLGQNKVDNATSTAITVLGKVWEHLSVQGYARIFSRYASVQKALYGFEQTEEGRRYRDHIIHVLNVFVSGLILFTKMFQTNASSAFLVLKARKEAELVPFASRYDERRRLYYLWSLMSTLHDIALPIQRQSDVLDGFNKFYGYFRIGAEDIVLRFPQMSAVRMAEYIHLMSRMFDKGIVLNTNEDKPTYRLVEERKCSPYFTATMIEALENRAHGVLAAYFLYDSLVGKFLKGHDEDLLYDLDVRAVEPPNHHRIELPRDRNKWASILEKNTDGSDSRDSNLKRIYGDGSETKVYQDYVLEQDVTRAALAISLHDAKPETSPKLFPIKFSKLPLTWLLILLDECQEYNRPEEFSSVELVRFQDFPLIDVIWNPNQPRFGISIDFTLKRPPESMVNPMVEKHDKLREKRGKAPLRTFDKLVEDTWNEMWKIIRAKLSFEETEPVALRISVKLADKSLPKFESDNWQTVVGS